MSPCQYAPGSAIQESWYFEYLAHEVPSAYATCAWRMRCLLHMQHVVFWHKRLVRQGLSPGWKGEHSITPEVGDRSPSQEVEGERGLGPYPTMVEMARVPLRSGRVTRSVSEGP